MNHATRLWPGAAATGRERLPALGARLGYVAVILLATLSRLQPEFDAAAIAERLARAMDLSLGARDAVDAVRNMVLFAGWGAVWLVTARGAATRSGAMRGGAAGGGATRAGPARGDAGRVQAARAVWGATATGAALSLLVEGAQLTSPIRTASPLDLLTNTLGAFSGAVSTAGLVRLLERSIGRRSFVGMPAGVFAGAYLGVLMAESVAPLFGEGPLPGAKGGPISRFATALDALEPATLLELPIRDVLLFLPAGFFGVLALIEAGLPSARAARWAGAIGVAAVLAGEIGHAAAGYRIGLGTILVHGGATVLGAWAARRWVAPLSQRWRGRARPRALLATYAALLAGWSWRPFRLETDPAELSMQFTVDHFVPLRALGERVDLFSAADVVIQFLLFLPLGVLLAAWPLRRAGRLSGPLPALYLAVALEISQLFIADRFFDITDLLVQAAGAGVGWAVATRAGIAPHGEVLPRA